MTARAYPIPDIALDDRIAIVGTSGSGKTYGAGTAVERVLATGGRVVVVDPLGVWYGLRLLPNGKAPSTFNVVIFGGAHADLPLTEASGAVIGEAVARGQESCILDLSGLGTKAAERRFMLAFLEALYRNASGAPVHLVFDEADLWAPQKAQEPQLQAKMEQIVRRGRVKGFIPWLITQRPAVLSKDVLSQADGVIAFKLTGEHDRTAIGGWIEGQADKSTGRDMLASLARMEKGEAVIWIPGRGVLDRAKFPAKATFDSSRTPSRGETINAAQLVPLDMRNLTLRIRSIIDEAKDNDPKALRAEITRLKSESGKHSVVSTETITAANQQGFDRGYRAAVNDYVSDLRTFADALAKLSASVQGALGAASMWIKPENAVKPPEPSPVPSPAPERTAEPVERPRPAAGSFSPSVRQILDTIHKAYPVGLSFDAAARRAGVSKRSSAYRKYRQDVLESGEVVGSENRIVSAHGFGRSEPLPPGAAVDAWVTRLPPSVGKMLKAIAEGWEGKETIAAAAGVSMTSSGLGSGLRELIELGLVVHSDGKYTLAEGL